MSALVDAGFLLQEGSLVQLRIDAMFWTAQKVSHVQPDPLTSKRLEGSEDTPVAVNQFFQDFYGQDGPSVHNMEGREHTGQVKNEDRQARETQFRNGELSTLFLLSNNGVRH